VTDPLALARLLAGRSNPEREAAVARRLTSCGAPFARHPFATPEGRGESFAVDLGSGDRVLVVCAHHDAVPGSPGANDNAAAVGVLFSLMERLASAPPRGLRVRLLFTACEELDYLGAREYVRAVGVAGVVGALSLELCGIGDSLVVWDAAEESAFTRVLGGALGSLGLRRDEGCHVVGRIPRFGSDHRAFAAAGVPACGLTVVPAANAEALRRFIFHPWLGAARFLLRRPAPFDTYHTPRDGLATLEPRALALTARALEAVVAAAG
jgi:Zn-dependent M28 family amino/carboxypeptidase